MHLLFKQIEEFQKMDEKFIQYLVGVLEPYGKTFSLHLSSELNVSIERVEAAIRSFSPQSSSTKTIISDLNKEISEATIGVAPKPPQIFIQKQENNTFVVTGETRFFEEQLSDFGGIQRPISESVPSTGDYVTQSLPGCSWLFSGHEKIFEIKNSLEKFGVTVGIIEEEKKAEIKPLPRPSVCKTSDGYFYSKQHKLLFKQYITSNKKRAYRCVGYREKKDDLDIMSITQEDKEKLDMWKIEIDPTVMGNGENGDRYSSCDENDESEGESDGEISASS